MRSLQYLALSAMLCILPSVFFAQEAVGEVLLESIPTTVEQFVALRDRIGSTPEGGATLFVIALMRYAEDQRAGLPMLVSILVNDNTLMSPAGHGKGYRGFDLSGGTRFLIDRVITSPWIPRSYIQGTAAENQYQLSEGVSSVAFETTLFDKIKTDEVRVYVKCTGADTPRPLRLKRNASGLWKVAELSSLVVGVRTVSQAVDEL